MALPDLADHTLDRFELSVDQPILKPARRVGVDAVTTWDLWIDHHRRDADGLTHGNIRDARPGVVLVEGQRIVVGNEDADAAVAEVARVDANGAVLVRVMPGSVDDHRAPSVGPNRP